MYYLIITALVVLAALLLSKAKKRFNYWQKCGVPTLKSQHVIFGDLTKAFLGKENLIGVVGEAYGDFKSRGCKFGGIYSFNNPMLLVVDPEIIRLVLTKDFEYFVGRGIEYDAESKPISAHLFNLDGEEWRFIRKKVTPSLTSGKLKTMFWIIEEKTDKLCAVIKKKPMENVYLIDLIERTGMDIISQTAFGLNSNVLEDEVSHFRAATKKVVHPSIHRVIYYAFKNIFKNLANIALLLSDDPKCNQFFIKIVEDTIKYRKQNNVRANDFLQMLIDMMEPKDGEEGISLEKVTAQAFVFFLAAYETTAKAINLAFYHLGKNLELQQELRQEVMNALEESGGKFTYEVVMNCKLLDMVVTETLRKETPVAFLNRICTRTYKIPGTDVEIEKGIPILIPIYDVHMDPDNYPNPEKFDPFRFSKENESGRKPYTYLPFGEGPRNCLGNRLGLYQVKVIVMKLIKNFEISVSPKTEEPLTLNPITETLLLHYKQKIYFDFKVID